MPNDKISNAEFNTSGNLRYENMDAFIDCDEFRKAVTGYGTIDWKYDTTDPRKPERIIRLVNANISDKLFADISPDGSEITTAELDHYISQRAHLYAAEDRFIHNTVNAWQSVDPKDDGIITFIEVDLLYHIMTHMHYGEPQSPPGNWHSHYAHIEVDNFKKIWNPAHGDARTKRADLKARVDSIDPDLRPAQLLKIKSNHPARIGEQYLLALQMQSKDPAQYGGFTLLTNPTVLARLNTNIAGLSDMSADALQNVVDTARMVATAQTALDALKKLPDTDPQKIAAQAQLASAKQSHEFALAATPTIAENTEVLFGLR